MANPREMLYTLILEDDYTTLMAILKAFEKDCLSYHMRILIVTDSLQVEEIINKSDQDFDLILLDRDCNIGGTFHILDFDKFDVNKMISISSVPEFNELAEEKGVTRTILKDYRYLDKFAEELMGIIKRDYKDKLHYLD